MKPNKSKKLPAKTAPGDSISARFAWALSVVFQGSQQQMAKALGCTQSLVSRVVRGRQKPGPKLVTALAEHPAMNREWVLTGEGKPLASQVTEYDGDAALPIAIEPFEGLPYEHPLSLKDVLYPVPRKLHRRSRYWVPMKPGHPFVSDNTLRIAAGDLVLFEPDQTEWPDDLIGRPCLVVVEIGDGRKLMFCRSEAHSSKHCTSNDFDFYKQLRSVAEDVNDLTNEEGRNLRGIAMHDSVSSTRTCSVRIVAVAIFRCGTT